VPPTARVAEVLPHPLFVELVGDEPGDRHSEDDREHDADRAAQNN
jgi:hypothetical protein